MTRSRLTLLGSRTAGVVLLLLLTAARAEAGPPLICEPFTPAPGAALLSWDDEGNGWNAPDPTYDRRRLVAEVLRLLSPGAPVLARMENLRRATIYAATDEKVAGELLAAVTARVRTAGGQGSADPLAWFDAGYLIESYRQATHIARWDMVSPGTRVWTMNNAPSADGYALVKKAMTMMAAPDAAVDFAASLMTTGAVSETHRARAAAIARPGSDIARQLARR
jgi:hypothetical protein